ncbi:MAG TPA: hypothetical protein VK569_00990 [Bacteroidota bacterium]|nr:hypothetical protein [Bacteroidota bacterium]
MSYKIRNSIALGILFFVILGVGTYIRAFNLPRKAKTIEKQVKQINEELENTPNLVNQFNDLSVLLTDTQKRWENRNKDIPPVDITSQSYAYFSRLIDLSGYVKLDMVYNGVQSRGNYGFNVYNLKGEAPFDNFYRFIWYLENDRKLYKIQSISLKGIEVAPTEKEEGKVLVTFDMVVHAYFSSVAELSSSLGERSITPNTLNVDPFTPVISSGIPPNTRDLVEIERSDLKAVITGKAYVLDQNNTIRTLQEGDEIYLGYLTKIDPEGGRIEGTLNKGGIIEKVELKIRYGPLQTVVKK